MSSLLRNVGVWRCKASNVSNTICLLNRKNNKYFHSYWCHKILCTTQYLFRTPVNYALTYSLAANQFYANAGHRMDQLMLLDIAAKFTHRSKIGKQMFVVWIDTLLPWISTFSNIIIVTIITDLFNNALNSCSAYIASNDWIINE